MRRMVLLLGLIAVGLLTSACAGTRLSQLNAAFPQTPVIPPPGFIYERVKAPLSVNYHYTPADPGRTGVSTVRYLQIPLLLGGLLSFSWGDGSVEEAANEGNIEVVEYADYEVFQVLTVYTEFTVIAHGR